MSDDFDDERRFKVSSACAMSKTEFALGLQPFPIDGDDSHATYLIYDASLNSAWSRVDANRSPSDITGHDGVYYALSEEEYVHVLTGQDGTTETIKGMGIHANGATEGAGNVIRMIGDVPFIAGQGSQLYYRKKKDDWERISTDIIPLGEHQKNVNFEGLGGITESNFFNCGTTVVEFFFDQELNDKIYAALEADDDDEYDRLDAIRASKDPKPEGRAYHYNGSDWTDIDVAGYFPKTVFVDSQGIAWFGCNKGTILRAERDEDGDFDVDDIEIIEDSLTTIYSITEFQGRLILASAEGLYAYNEDFDSLDDEIVQIKPKLSKSQSGLSPLKVQAVDDVMFYFDYNLGVYIWDGDKTWIHIPIPPVLLEREFKGL